MNKKLILLLIAASTFFTSCEKDEDKNDTSNSNSTNNNSQNETSSKYYFEGTIGNKAVNLQHSASLSPASSFYAYETDYDDNFNFYYINYMTGGSILSLSGLRSEPTKDQFMIGIYRPYGITCSNFKADFTEGSSHTFIDSEYGLENLVGMYFTFSDSDGKEWSSMDGANDKASQISNAYCNITSSKENNDPLASGELIVTIEFKCAAYDKDGNKEIIEAIYHGPAIDCP